MLMELAAEEEMSQQADEQLVVTVTMRVPQPVAQ